MTLYYNMSVAQKSGNVPEAGQQLGKFLSLFMQIEIPETTSAPTYQSVDSLM